MIDNDLMLMFNVLCQHDNGGNGDIDIWEQFYVCTFLTLTLYHDYTLLINMYEIHLARYNRLAF